jgi:hypothetical protein
MLRVTVITDRHQCPAPAERVAHPAFYPSDGSATSPTLWTATLNDIPK